MASPPFGSMSVKLCPVYHELIGEILNLIKLHKDYLVGREDAVYDINLFQYGLNHEGRLII